MQLQTAVDFVATAAARLEESAYPNAIILPNFPCSIQLDYYSCGAKSAYTIPKYFGKRCTPLSVELELRTAYEGTSISDIKRVLKRHGLKYRKIRDLRRAIDDGHPALLSLYEHWHYPVCYGQSDSHYFVMKPSLGDMGSLSRAVRKKKLKRVWDGWGLEVKSH
ncbi:MAG TPA: cysteine peptidase family C39 domain-containing protein [Bacteroidota bacterium]|nr:cysteine peptidase family C39 domain-containing protein [Bacteroidota bacterium]